MLTLTPVVCVLAGIAFSSIFDKYATEEGDKKYAENKDLKDANGNYDIMKAPNLIFLIDRRLYDKATASAKNKGSKGTTSFNPSSTTTTDSVDPIGVNTRSIVLVVFLFILMMYVAHCTYVTSNAYSHPSVVLQSHTNDG
jgi:dolichyl-diphosphooligosaccharide--protein glycosyltransferase